MRMRWLPALVWLALVVPAVPARAGEKPGDPPVVVVRIHSIETVLENAKAIAKLTGTEEIGRQIEGIIKAKTGPKGLEGIDTKRPIGFYLRVGNDLSNVAVVVLVPISDETAFLGLLENLNFPAKKDAGGGYTIEPSGPLPVQINFRFAHKYAYFTAINVDAISKANLIAPATIFAAKHKALASATIRLDLIPDVAKQIALQQVDDALAREKEKKPGRETEKQREFREKTLDAVGAEIASIINHGQELNAQLDLDQATKQLVAEISFSAKPNTKLAANLEELGKAKSLFGALMSGDNAMSGLVHMALPKELRKTFTDVVEDGVREGLAKEKDDTKREQAKQFLKSLEPTLKAGVLDGAFILRGPSEDKKYTLIAGLKLKNADDVETTVRQLLKGLPPAEQAMIKMDAETVGAVKIHQIDAQSKYDAKAREAFGDNPVYFAFRPDGVVVVAGANGRAAIKEAVTAEPATTAPVQFQIALARLAPAFAKTEEQKAVVNKVFGGGNPGQIRVILEGGPALRVRLAADLSVLQFMAQFYVQARAQIGAASAPPKD